MPAGTEASQWAPSSAPIAPASKEPGKEGGNTRAPRGNNNGPRRGKPRGKQSSANTNSGGGASAAAEPPAATAPANDAPHKKLIDRLDMTPETAPAPASAPKSDSPATSRRGKGRTGSRRKSVPAKVNTAAAQKELEQETVEEPEPIVPEPAAEPPKDAPPHISGTDADANTLAPSVNGLADRLKALNPSAPTTPRPFTPSAIDWAGDTEDGSLPDLDDWGVTAKSTGSTHKDEPESKPAEKVAPSVPDAKPNGRNNRRNEPRAAKNLSVPGRNGPNANGNGSSRPVTPSSAGFGSPSLRNRQGPRASPRTSTLNDPPPHITVTSNTTEDQSKRVTQGLGLDFADEPVFPSLNDPPLEPPPEDLHIKPVRAPNTHPNPRGTRGRGGRPRMSDGNGQSRAGSGFGAPMQMPPSPHMPPSPYMPPSPHMPPSPYLPNGPFAPNGYPGFGPGQPMGYPQPHSSGFGGPGPVYGHQHSYSHPQHSPRHNTHHHSPRNNTHQDSTAPRHQRAHSRPVIAGSALSNLNRTLQGTVSPPKPKADVTS